MRGITRIAMYSALLALAGSVLLLAGCGDDGSDAEVPFEGTYWVCQEFVVDGELEALVPESHMDITFEGVSASGSSGCNNFSGEYTLDANSITIGPLNSTLMACDDPLMEQETHFLAAISSAAEWHVAGDTLTLYDADGDDVAVFEADMSPLTGHAWMCTGYNNGQGGVVSLAADTTMTIEFSENDEANGSSGCNTFSAEYAVDDEDAMSFEQIAVTEMYCASPEGIMEQEERFLDALTTVATYEIRGDSLTLRTADGAAAATFKLQ